MGFDDQEIVALSGAHNLGKCHYQDSGYDGVWSETPWKFDNSYFNILVQPLAMTRDDEPDWTPVTLPNGKIQYEDPNHVYIMLPSDLALLQVSFSFFFREWQCACASPMASCAFSCPRYAIN